MQQIVENESYYSFPFASLFFSFEEKAKTTDTRLSFQRLNAKTSKERL